MMDEEGTVFLEERRKSGKTEYLNCLDEREANR